MARDLYDVLGVTAKDDQATITAAYRRLVLAYHPDRNADPAAANKTAEINRAYGVLSDPIKRARYDQRRTDAAKQRSPVPRAILGTKVLMLYDFLERKPRHRQILWEKDGIWGAISNHFPECKARGCLVLLRIDPATTEQIYQHGDPGPTLRINPQKGEFKLLTPWLTECHSLEDPA
jgi:curved DNA-binding protein CbpA